jgi:hypothetical protein
VRRNFATDALIMLGAAASLGFLLAGIKSSASVLSGTAVAAALLATLAKFTLGRNRRSPAPPSPNSPRRRSSDQ